MKSTFIVILSLLLISACSHRLQAPDSKSGFLKDYHLFKPNPQNDHSWVRTKRGFKLEDFAKYQSIALAPVELWLTPDKPHQIKDKSKQKRLTAYFEQQIKAKVGNKYQFVEPGTEGALLIRMAITNITEKSPDIDPLDILPFRIVMNAGESAYRLATKQKAVIASASLEVEFVDTDANRGLVAVIIHHTSDEMNVADNTSNIDSGKAIVDDLVNKLADALNGQR